MRLASFGEVCFAVSRLVRFRRSEGCNRGLRGSAWTGLWTVAEDPRTSGAPHGSEQNPSVDGLQSLGACSRLNFNDFHFCSSLKTSVPTPFDRLRGFRIFRAELKWSMGKLKTVNENRNKSESRSDVSLGVRAALNANQI